LSVFGGGKLAGAFVFTVIDDAVQATPELVSAERKWLETSEKRSS
jgi:hypothetical protein